MAFATLSSLEKFTQINSTAWRENKIESMSTTQLIKKANAEVTPPKIRGGEWLEVAKKAYPVADS